VGNSRPNTMVKGEAMKIEDIWAVENGFETYQDIFFKALLLDKVKVVPKLDKNKLYYQILVDKIGE
jgi:hypothetical protein